MKIKFMIFIETTLKDYPELENWKKRLKKKVSGIYFSSYYGDLSPGYSNLEYAPLAEKNGKTYLGI